MSRHRVVFRESVSSGDLGAFCDSQGWCFEGWFEGTKDEAAEYVWFASDGTEVHWLDDPVLHLTYALVGGDHPVVTATRIAAAFDAYTVDDVRECAAAEEWEDRVLLLSPVAATAPDEFYQPTFEAMAAALTDAHPFVRHKAVLAVFYAQWEEFLPLLRECRDGDPDHEVRATAAVAVDAIVQSRDQ